MSSIPSTTMTGGVGKVNNVRVCLPNRIVAAIPCTTLIFITAILVITVTAEPNKIYYASKLCGRDRPQPLYKAVDGAVVISEMDSDLNCTMTFQTESVLQHFMARFEELALDCQDNLYVYDGDLATGRSKAALSCRSTRSETGTIFTQSNFLTLRYETDRFTKPGDGFRLVITSYKDTQMGCTQFRCQRNSFCISRDLTCDGVNHCGDGSDESTVAGCYQAPETLEPAIVLGLDFNIFMGIILSVFVVCLICVVNLIVCLCRSTTQQRIALHHGQSMMTLNPQGVGMNETALLSSPYHQTAVTDGFGGQTTRYATLPLHHHVDKEGGKPPPYTPNQGNGLIPASAIYHQQQQQQHIGMSNSNNQLLSPFHQGPGHGHHGHPHVIVTDNGTGNGVLPHHVVYYTHK